MKRLFATLATLFFGATVIAQTAGNRPEVKNIVLMIGDGMGPAQVTALMLSQAPTPINMERAEVGGFVKTRSADDRVTDSAASATAYATGEKTKNGYIGVGPDGEKLETILEKAERKGLSTGLVATQHLNHATPAAFYGHNPDRDDYKGLAEDLKKVDIEVLLGGAGDGKGVGMPSITDRRNPRDPEWLAGATREALGALAGDPDGFFLMVEGSYIDNGGHDNDPARILGEAADFDRAVGVALDFAEANPGTLVIITADHETGGLTLPEADEPTTLPALGQTDAVAFQFSTRGHSATMVPLFAFGPSAEIFGGIQDNTAVNHKMERLLGLGD